MSTGVALQFQLMRKNKRKSEEVVSTSMETARHDFPDRHLRRLRLILRLEHSISKRVKSGSPIVTFLLRCNSDITSLLSGTAIKAIVAYISDYVTKPGLKTYTIFDTIRSVFDRSSEMLGGTQERKDKARSLLTKIVNALTAKLEIGGPMASLYLLGNPDHYTNQNFIVFYWKSYVTEVFKAWKQDGDVQSDKVILLKNVDGKFIGLSID